MGTTRTRSRGYWPTPVQEQLLDAALGDPAGSVAVWRALQPRFSLDELEPGSFELLPLVYRNLSSTEYDDPLLPRLKGIYRRAWVKNNLLLERTKEIGEALRAAGIQALFLEGAVLADRYYPELGLRPTSTTHLLVRADEAAGAVVALERIGWRVRAASGDYPGWRFLFDDDGNVCVLRTSIAFDFAAAEGAVSDAPLWESAERQAVAGTEVLVPAPTDALLAICVSGARLSPLPRTQWIADAAMVLRGHEVDWRRLVELGQGRGQTLRLRAVFDYLLRLPVPHPPEEVHIRLDEASVTRRERLIYALSSRSIRGLGGVPETTAAHLAATPHESLARALVSLPARFRDRWGLQHTWQVPLAASRRVISAVGKRAE